jgi:hypothetical protein
MRWLTWLVLVAGAALGGLCVWLLVDMRQDPGQGVAQTLIGAVLGVFLAIGVLTKGTYAFNKPGRTHKRGLPPSPAAGADPLATHHTQDNHGGGGM